MFPSTALEQINHVMQSVIMSDIVVTLDVKVANSQGEYISGQKREVLRNVPLLLGKL